jgi:hypothetical protein
LPFSTEVTVQIFNHFGHLAHARQFGAFLAVAIGAFVAVGIGGWVALSSQKDSDD